MKAQFVIDGKTLFLKYFDVPPDAKWRGSGFLHHLADFKLETKT